MRAILAQVSPYLPRQNGSGTSIEKLIEFAHHLPSEIFSPYFVIEYSCKTGCLDLSFCHRNSSWSQLAAGMQKVASWSEISHLCQPLFSEEENFKKALPALWFEFDLEERGIWPPQPNIQFANKKSIDRNRASALCHLLGREIDPILIQAEECTLKLVYTGFMLARAPEWVKLGFSLNNNPDLAAPFLQKMGYRDLASPLICLLKKIQPFLRECDLQIDVNKTLSSKISVECYAEHADSGYQWIPILDILVLERVITETEKSSLLSWIGAEGAHCIRRISFLKIVYETGKPIYLKAYLGVILLSTPL